MPERQGRRSPDHRGKDRKQNPHWDHPEQWASPLPTMACAPSASRAARLICLFSRRSRMPFAMAQRRTAPAGPEGSRRWRSDARPNEGSEPADHGPARDQVEKGDAEARRLCPIERDDGRCEVERHEGRAIDHLNDRSHGMIEGTIGLAFPGLPLARRPCSSSFSSALECSGATAIAAPVTRPPSLPPQR